MLFLPNVTFCALFLMCWVNLQNGFFRSPGCCPHTAVMPTVEEANKLSPRRTTIILKYIPATLEHLNCHLLKRHFLWGPSPSPPCPTALALLRAPWHLVLTVLVNSSPLQTVPRPPGGALRPLRTETRPLRCSVITGEVRLGDMVPCNFSRRL